LTGLDRLHQHCVVLLGLIAIGFREIGRGLAESFGLDTAARNLGGIVGARMGACEDGATAKRLLTVRQ
jgi:hypothetical protein